MDYFAKMKVKPPEFVQLSEGEHLVRIARMEEVTSFENFDQSAKSKMPEWADPTPQLAITVVATEKGKTGALTHRYNGRGFLKWDKLSDKDKASDKFVNSAGYACVKDKDGDLIRVEDPEKTAACENIIMQLAAAAKIPQDTNLLEGLAEAIENQTVIRVTVTNVPFEGKDQLRITRVRKVAETVVDDGFED